MARELVAQGTQFRVVERDGADVLTQIDQRLRVRRSRHRCCCLAPPPPPSAPSTAEPRRPSSVADAAGASPSRRCKASHTLVPVARPAPYNTDDRANDRALGGDDERERRRRCDWPGAATPPATRRSRTRM